MFIQHNGAACPASSVPNPPRVLLGLLKHAALHPDRTAGAVAPGFSWVIVNGVRPLAAEEPRLQPLCASAPAAARGACVRLCATAPAGAIALQQALALWLAVPVWAANPLFRRSMVPADRKDPKVLRIRLPLPGAGLTTVEIAPNGDVAMPRLYAEALDVALPTAAEWMRLRGPRRLPRPHPLVELDRVVNCGAPEGRWMDPNPRAISNLAAVLVGPQPLAEELHRRELTPVLLDDQPPELLAGLLVSDAMLHAGNSRSKRRGRITSIAPLPTTPSPTNGVPMLPSRLLRVAGHLNGKPWEVVTAKDGRLVSADAVHRRPE